MVNVFKLSCIKKTLLVVHLVLILVLVVSIVTSIVLHGINPTLFLMTVFDLNSVIRLSETLQNPRDNQNSASYIAINSPSPEFLFIALTLYITAIFNQIIAIVALIRQHLCVVVFCLMINLVVFCLSINFVKTNLFMVLIMVVLLTISYTIMLKQAKNNVHHSEQINPYAVVNHGNHSMAPARVPHDNYTVHGVTVADHQHNVMYQPNHTAPSTPNEPKILAPIIYCPHYTESVC